MIDLAQYDAVRTPSRSATSRKYLIQVWQPEDGREPSFKTVAYSAETVERAMNRMTNVAAKKYPNNIRVRVELVEAA